MATAREWITRLGDTIWPRRRDADLEQELRLHLELTAEDARLAGALPDRAAQSASIRAGSLAQTMEVLRDQRGLPRLDDLMRDVRHAIRLTRRNPAFAAVAVLSLALGIGVNGAIFSLTDALILRPLPIHDPGAVVTITADTADEGVAGGRVSYPNYRDLRRASRSLDGILAYRLTTVGFARSRQMIPEMRIGVLVSDNYFEVLGIRPAVGRTFTREEGQVADRDAVVVLSYDFWSSKLDADPSILDDVVWMNGIDFHVIGVAPPGFTGTDAVLRPAFYAPIVIAGRLDSTPDSRLEDRQARSVGVKGRLNRGVSKQSAEAELTMLWKGLERQYPDANRTRTIAVRSELEERIREDPWDTIIMGILSALALIVLTIACANVANLMLGRGRARAREMAIRLALGISRPRLLRQLMTESLLLALVGGVLGLGVAYGGIRFLQNIPAPDQIVIAPQLDQRVVVFGLLAAAMSAILVGWAPARQSLKTDLVPTLKSPELRDGPPEAMDKRSVLVVAQVALSTVLLIATGMLFDGFRKAIVLNPGVRTDHLLMMSLDTSLVRYTPAQTRTFYRDLRDRARAAAGVASVTVTSAVPFSMGDQQALAVIPDGYRFPRGQDNASTFAAVVDERYFDTMRIETIRGRSFTADDRVDTRGVAIVNEEFARTYWPNQDAIGKRLRLSDAGSPWMEVVGVTKTGKYMWIAEAPMPFLYLPFAQHERSRMSLLVQATNPDAGYLSTPLRSVVQALDINQPVFNVRTFSSLYRQRTIAVPLMIMQMAGSMGLLGLILALIGLYALVAYSVARRTREIGIRMAVGAGKSDVIIMVLRHGLMLSVAGIVTGGIASVAVARVLRAALVGLGTPNPATYVIVPVALICLTMIATYFPARRATHVDPLVALRDE
jgi:predicted permease